MPIYKVNVSIVMVVDAKDAEDAEIVARKHLTEEDHFSFGYMASRSPLTSLGQLPEGWDGECVAWGGDRTKSLKEILGN